VKIALVGFCLISTIYFWKKDDLALREKIFAYMAVSNIRPDEFIISLDSTSQFEASIPPYSSIPSGEFRRDEFIISLDFITCFEASMPPYSSIPS
jgi:hypothetical protein